MKILSNEKKMSSKQTKLRERERSPSSVFGRSLSATDFDLKLELIGEGFAIQFYSIEISHIFFFFFSFEGVMERFIYLGINKRK